MNNATKKVLANATLRAAQAQSRYGNPEPQVEVRMPRGTPYRQLHAALHLLAADAELATPTRERWVVQTEVTSDERGRVYLELANATKDEAERGLALLHAVIA